MTSLLSGFISTIFNEFSNVSVMNADVNSMVLQLQKSINTNEAQSKREQQSRREQAFLQQILKWTRQIRNNNTRIDAERLGLHPTAKIRPYKPKITSHEPASFKCTSSRRTGFNSTNTTTTVKVRVQDIRMHKRIHGTAEAKEIHRSVNG